MVSIHAREQVEQRAAEWLAKQDGHELTAGEERELTNWLNDSTAQRVAYIRLGEAWCKLRQLGVHVRVLGCRRD